MLSFFMLGLPLLIGVGEWYMGHPAASGIRWFQVTTNAFAWGILNVTWVYVKQINRATARYFDEAITRLPARSATATVVAVQG